MDTTRREIEVSPDSTALSQTPQDSPELHPRGNLIRFRKWASKSGLDPNVWFFNTEEGAARIVGYETDQYVSNIYKYYIAYRLLTEREAKATTAKSAATEKLNAGE